MKYIKLFENFSEEKNSMEYPNLIEVKLTDVLKDSKNLYKMPDTVELPNDDELYSYIGNTELDGFSGVIYFASRRGNLIFITGLDLKGAERKYDLNSLTSTYAKSKTELDRSGLRNFPEATCTLGPNADYAGELEIGMKDHRGYFEIVSVK
jgi:hypothetical protein